MQQRCWWLEAVPPPAWVWRHGWLRHLVQQRQHMREASLLVWTPWQAVRLLHAMSAAGQQWLRGPLVLLQLLLPVMVVVLLQAQGYGRGAWYRDRHVLALADV